MKAPDVRLVVILSNQHYICACEGDARRHIFETKAHALPGDCKAISAVLARIGDKWTVLVVNFLGRGAKRFSEIRREVGGISQRMLTLTLRALERDGLVTRTVLPANPPRVEYALTPLGVSLLEPVQTLGTWALDNQETMRDARERFDRVNATAPR